MIYVGMTDPSNRLVTKGKRQKKKEGAGEKDQEGNGKENKQVSITARVNQ